MATNAIETEHRLEEAVFLPRKVDPESNGAPSPAIEKGQTAKPAAENLGSGTEELRRNGLGVPQDASQDLALAPLADNVAYGLASVLVVAIRGLENHMASETREGGERRPPLDDLQTGFQDPTEAISEQRSMNLAVQDKCQQLAAGAVPAGIPGSPGRGIGNYPKETGEFSATVSERIEVNFKELGAFTRKTSPPSSQRSLDSTREETLYQSSDLQTSGRPAFHVRHLCAS